MSELQWCATRSRENLVFFFRVELIETRDHKIRPRVPGNVYRQLLAEGLISKSKRGTRTEYTLSPLVLTILSELEGKKMMKNALLGLCEISPEVGYPVPGLETSLTDIEEGKK